MDEETPLQALQRFKYNFIMLGGTDWDWFNSHFYPLVKLATKKKEKGLKNGN